MNRFGCFLLIITIGLLFNGAQGIFESSRNRAPRDVSFDQFAELKPTGGWFHVKGGVLHVPDATWFYELGDDATQEVYVPLVGLGVLSAERTKFGQLKGSVLVQVTDPEILDIVQEMRKLEDDKNSSDSKLDSFLERHKSKLWPAQDVNGMVAFGTNPVDSSDRAKIKEANPGLAEDFVVLKQGAKPQGIAISILRLALGLMAGAGAIVLFSRKASV